MIIWEDKKGNVCCRLTDRPMEQEMDANLYREPSQEMTNVCEIHVSLNPFLIYKRTLEL